MTHNKILISIKDELKKKMSKLKTGKNEFVTKAFVYGSSAMALVSSMSMSVFASSDLFGAAKTALSSVYNQILGIVNIVAVVCAAIALLFLIFSKNQRAVESSKEWLKRIAIAWVAINCLGWIIKTLEGWVAGGKYSG